jgi:hypothetical protein
MIKRTAVVSRLLRKQKPIDSEKPVEHVDSHHRVAPDLSAPTKNPAAAGRIRQGLQELRLNYFLA